MSLKLKFTDEHGIVHIDMTPAASTSRRTDAYITDPKFDTINNRFGQYDLFGAKYESSGDGDGQQSLFRSRYNSVEEELANTPYAFATERSLRLNTSNDIDITIETNTSPSRDIEDDRFFSRRDDCEPYGSKIDLKNEAFTVTQLIHAQDRYYDLSSRQSGDVTCSVPITARTNVGDGAFEVINSVISDGVRTAAASSPTVSVTKNKREKSFAILTDIPAISRPTSPRSLPSDIRQERISPFRGRGFREETSRHNTPKTSAHNSRSCSPSRRRTNSLSKIDKMAQTATLTLPVQLSRPHSPRNFLKENIEEIRGLSELNREKHEQEAEKSRIEEEETLLREMGILDKKSIRSRSTSRSNSPSKINLRSRSNSPSAILHFETIPSDSKEFVNAEDGNKTKPVTHRSRLRSVSRSQPKSNEVSPKHSKIPKRQNSVSPTRTPARETTTSRRLRLNSLGQNQRFISTSTSSIHETIRIGSQVHDKRGMSKSNQYLDASPVSIKGKPPISPAKNGPPPSNKTINSKRLSPIVGTPNKSSIEVSKLAPIKLPGKPSSVTKKNAGNSTPSVSRLNSRPPSRAVSRDPSPDIHITKKSGPKHNQTKPASRITNTKTNQTPQVTNKSEVKKPVNRTNSNKSLTRTPSTKTLNEKPPVLIKTNSRKDLNEKTYPYNKGNELSSKKSIVKDGNRPLKGIDKKNETVAKAKESNGSVEQSAESVKTGEVKTQDNETQYDKMANGNGELVIMTKKSVVSMTTAAITSQPLEVVATVTNQLPTVLEKAREKAIFERLSSKDSLMGKDEEKAKEAVTDDLKEVKLQPEVIKEHIEEKKEELENENAKEKEKNDEKKVMKPIKNFAEKTMFTEENIKLRPLQPPYNNPQLDRVKQKIDDIFKEPEISRENILTASAKSREAMNTFKSVAEKTKNSTKDIKNDVVIKLTDIKDQLSKQNEKMASEMRSEAVKIVDSIMTPVELPIDETAKITEVKKNIEPTVIVVSEKKNNTLTDAITINEALVKGDAEVEVQSSNVSTPIVDKLGETIKTVNSNGSDKSVHSNGGYPGQSTLLRFPQSTSTTPKPPVRTRRESKKTPPDEETTETDERPAEIKPPNLCERIMGKCKSKCCPCCIKGTKEDDSDIKDAEVEAKERVESMKDDERSRNEIDVEMIANKKKGLMDKINCFKRKEKTEESIREVEVEASKASIEFESETKRKRTLRDALCCCGRSRRVSDASIPGAPVVPSAEAGCCGKRRIRPDRRDSILSDRIPTSCCNNRFCTWLRGICGRHSEHSSSRRTSEFSKNKSLSPTLPPEVLDSKSDVHKLSLSYERSPKKSESRLRTVIGVTTLVRYTRAEQASRIKLDPAATELKEGATEGLDEDLEDTRKKLDTSLVEHTSVMRGAIPILPIVLAYFCLFCNVIVPGLGTILSGLFCLCFGIPRFGVHDGLKHRIGSFVINLLVGCGQLFTVLFCLVGWGWSIWWGVIFVKISRKYRKLKAEAASHEVEAAPPVTTNNHTRP